MYRTIQQSLLARIQAILLAKYDVTLTNLVVEQPPSIALGELALPVAFELAKRLRKAPRAIAAELAAELTAALPSLEGVASVEVAGAGYLNIRLDRAAAVRRIAADQHADIGGPGFRLVEHTSINPNKAAHIGHLRNAILGDTFQRLLRPDTFKTGYEVGVQNYIDNTGVQVADVVVGLVYLEGKTLTSTRELLTELLETNQRIDFYCWDLYARVSQWYTADPEHIDARKQIRLDTLHALELGKNDTADIADLISTAVLRRHLETMQRLNIEYDFLPRESEILSLHFWDAARELMLEKGVLYLETAGKNKGCYVMRRAGNEPGAPHLDSEMWDSTNPTTSDSSLPDEDAKVIVRSNGTVTYVGKDIAYHLWKFGLLPGKDFGYAKFREYPDRCCWISTTHGETPHPSFGHADAIYNVIDSRQNDPQNNVIAALRGMGYTEAADNYTHFSYEMVALTPRCAVELGYTISEEDQKKPFIEVSGRKGFGVKADDLLDRLIAAAKSEVDTRHPEIEPAERLTIATQIAVGALRYFMLRFTRNTVIAFDFKDALSFEGETGPYVQYAIVRAANIFRKANTTEAASLAAIATLDLSNILDTEEGSSLWETWLLASKLTLLTEQCIATAEPAYLAKYAFQLAQQFNNFYHRHHVLNETNPTRKALLLATAAVAQREMIRALDYLGIEAPPVM
ncbi:DALR anticodon-binding domain-containing protein [Tunturiibacter gelidoferens]|uniref:Arginyl-tRNA synthetase n=1 Tax=Tunturiibacter gelidiferens TaxID=3069689 RepID=A0ACC5NUJ9_9BACT|nr:DALR anticodon-binding domain-containing protein [Edaphobacter lichenicola]MBB5338272.1 arginyl-tRNA synthetase [Edaphobacter lichenicola]